MYLRQRIGGEAASPPIYSLLAPCSITIIIMLSWVVRLKAQSLMRRAYTETGYFNECTSFGISIIVLTLVFPLFSIKLLFIDRCEGVEFCDSSLQTVNT